MTMCPHMCVREYNRQLQAGRGWGRLEGWVPAPHCPLSGPPRTQPHLPLTSMGPPNLEVRCCSRTRHCRTPTPRRSSLSLRASLQAWHGATLLCTTSPSLLAPGTLRYHPGVRGLLLSSLPPERWPSGSSLRPCVCTGAWHPRGAPMSTCESGVWACQCWNQDRPCPTD